MRALGVVAGSVVVACVSASCLSPTEIYLELQTNACSSIDHVDIYVGGVDASVTAPTAVAHGCADPGTNTVGTLVVVPSASQEDTVRIVAAGAFSPASCDPNAPGASCVVARRTIGYVPHRALHLPIFLDSACAGVACPEGSTCAVVNGSPTCVSDVSTCGGSGAPETTNQCGLDGGSSDGGISIDATPIDANPITCPSPAAGIVTGLPTLSWSFSNPDLTNVHEDQDRVPAEALLSTSSFGPHLPDCGLALGASAAQNLAAAASAFDVTAFTIAFAYSASQGNGGTLLELRTGAPQGGFHVNLNSTAGTLAVFFHGAVDKVVFSDTTPTNDGAWHTFVMQLSLDPNNNSVGAFWVDGQPIGSTSTLSASYIHTTGPLVVGAMSAKAWVDSVEFYGAPAN